MPIFSNGEGGFSVRQKINAAIEQVDATGKQYASVADFVADADYTAPNGTVVSAGPVQFQADSTANVTGLRAGWVPFGYVTPDHWQDNTTPGTTVMTTALQNAINYIGSLGGGEVKLISLDYNINVANIRIQSNRTVIRGQGKYTTRLTLTAQVTGDIFRIEGPDRNAASIVHTAFHDLSIWCTAQQTASTAFRIRDAQHIIFENVHLRNVHIAWDSQGLQQAYFDNTDIFNSRAAVAVGSRYWKLAATTGAAVKNTEIFITNPNWRNVQSSPAKNTEVGIEISSMDGVWITGGHIMGCEQQINLSPETSTTQLVGLKCSNVWFDGYSDYHIYIEGNSTGGFGSFEFDGCRGQNCSVMSVFVDAACVNLTRFEINGGMWSTEDTADYIFRIDGGTIRIDGADIVSSRDMSTAVAAVWFGPAAKDWSVNGGIVGATGGNFPVGIQADQRIDLNAQIDGVKFVGCDTEIDVRSFYDDGTKITSCVSDKAPATLSGVVSAASIVLPAVAEVVNLTGVSTDVITNMGGNWDGRRVLLRASGASRTFGHNLGTAGTNIITDTFADKTIAVGRFATATYSATTGTWFLS